MIVSFIISFGVVKALANLVSGQLADAWGRKRVLILGWLFGLPVPFILMAAPTWSWIVAANVLLGLNQGFAWSMTVIMKVDLVGPKSRGLAVGLNEFAGYLAVGVTAFLTGYLASRYGLAAGADLSRRRLRGRGSRFCRSCSCATRASMCAPKIGDDRIRAPLISFREIFELTSFRDRNLFAASQAGLVNNLNDGMSWGIFPCSLPRSVWVSSASVSSRRSIPRCGAFCRWRPGR